MENFSPEAIAKAQYYLQRKASGQRISLYGESEEVKRAWNYYGNLPESQRAISQGTEIKRASLGRDIETNIPIEGASVYKSPEEYLEIARWGQKLAESKIQPKEVPEVRQGYSYIDRATGRGYEVSPEGKVKEINPREQLSQARVGTRQDYVNQQEELMNQQRQKSIEKDYSFYNQNPFIQKYISKPDEEGVSLIRKEKEIPQTVRDTGGNVYFKYKDGSKILIDQIYSKAPDYINNLEVQPATTFQKIQTYFAKKGVYIPSAKEISSNILRSEQKPYEKVEKITIRRVAGDIGESIVSTLPKIAGETIGQLFFTTREAIPYKFQEVTIPEKKFIVPQRITVTEQYPGQEITIPEKTYEPLSAESLRKKGKLIGEIGAYSVLGTLSPSAFFAASIGATQTPREIPKEQRISYGLLTGLSAIPVVSKGYVYLKQPIVKTLPKPIPKYYSVDVIQPVQQGERYIERGAFKLFRYIEPRKAEVTNRLRNLFGMKPKVVEISKPRLDIAFTPEPITIEKGKIEGGLFVTKRATKIPQKGYYNIFEYNAQSQPLDIEAFSNLPKTQQYAYQRIAETKVGRPIPLELTPQILGKDFQYSIGDLEARQMFKIRRTGSIIDIRKPTIGKTITRQQVSTIAKQLETPNEYQIFNTLTISKDVTKPLSRAAGNLPIIKGKTLVLPIKDLTPKEVNFISRSLETIQRQKPSIQVMEQAKQIAIKTLPKPRSISIENIKTISSQELAPLMVGGEGKVISKFYGRSNYLIEETFIPQTKIIPGTTSVLINKEIQVTKQPTVEVSKTKQLETLSFPQVEIIKQPSLEIQKQPQAQSEVQLLVSTQIQKQSLRQLQKSNFQQKQSFSNKNKIKPKITIIPFTLGLGKALSKVSKISEDTFEVFGKRFGKDIKLFETTDLGKAEEKTLQFLKGTLGRSAKITKGGKALEFSKLRLSKNIEFRPAKRESTRIVQKAKYSLGTGAEVKEIQYFKRKRK